MATTVARRYAQAVFELARDSQSFEAWERDLAVLNAVMTDPVTSTYLSSPKTPYADKQALLEKAMESAQPEAKRLTGMLLERRRLSSVPEIYEQYQALLRIAEALASQQTLPDLLRELRVQLREVVPYNGVIVLLYDEARDLMREYLLESELGLTNGLPRELPAEGTPGGWVCHTQEPFFVSDTLQEPRFREMNLMVAETGVRSYCVLPLTSAGRKLGAIGFASGQLSAYDPKDRDFFLLVARQVAVAVDNALHLDAARQSQAHLARERDRLQLLLDINNVEQRRTVARGLRRRTLDRRLDIEDADRPAGPKHALRPSEDPSIHFRAEVMKDIREDDDIGAS